MPEKLLKQLVWHKNGSLSQEDFEKTKGYLIQWIQKASPKKLELFVRTATSNKTLCNENLRMEIYQWDPQRIPAAHTCFFSLEIPGSYPTQEHFEGKLEILLAEGLAGTGFQFA